MTKTQAPAAPATPVVTFGEFVAPEKTNPWTETVAQLAAVGSDNAAVTIEVDVNESAKTQLAFQKAANAINKTARLRVTDDSAVTVAGQDEDGKDVQAGNVKLTFTLTKRHNVRRGQVVTPAESAETAATEEAPAE